MANVGTSGKRITIELSHAEAYLLKAVFERIGGLGRYRDFMDGLTRRLHELIALPDSKQPEMHFGYHKKCARCGQSGNAIYLYSQEYFDWHMTEGPGNIVSAPNADKKKCAVRLIDLEG